MLGAEQRDWLLGELDTSDAAWRIVATPSIFTRTWCDAPDEPLKTALAKLKLMDEDGEGPDFDQWDGYPAERARLIDHLRDRSIGNVVFLSADIHVSLASEVTDGRSAEPVGVELTAPSLTSQNLDEKLGVASRDPQIVASEDAYVASHEHVHWCELSSHGFVVVDVDPERVRGEWWHVDTVLQPSEGVTRAAVFEVPRGEPRLRRSA